MRDSALYVGLPLIFAGQIAWLIASERAKSWLTENDPTFEREGVVARMFIGRLFTSFGPMARYAEMRRERGESTTLTTVFYAGVATSMFGLVVLFLMITR